MKQVENRHLTDVWAVLVQGHGRIIAHDFCVIHRWANSGLSTLNRTKSILSIYHQQRQLHNQRGMCLNDTYPFCQQPLSGNCHSICFSKPVLWTATPGNALFLSPRSGLAQAARSIGPTFHRWNFFQRNFAKCDIKAKKLTIIYNNSEKRLHCLRNGSKKQIIYLIFR